MEGTRIAVLDNAVAWALRQDAPANGSNAENIYWLYGSPGLGKTSIANSLCERLHRTRNLGGSFFCKRDDPILRQPKRVLPTLISKLAEMWSPYRKLVSQALQDDPQLNPDSAGGEILLKLLKSVQKHPPRTFVLVIDALDECGESDTRKPLLNSLLNACSQVPWLKIIVTSRPEHDIEIFFKKHLVASRNLATDDPTRKDITLFTKKSMASVAESCNLTDWPSEEQLKQIVQRSGGLFIFVETLRRLLGQPDQLDPEPLLAQVLDGDLKEANAELYTLYSTTITTRIGSYKDTFRVVAQAIVAVAKYRPLCDDTLACLLGLKSPMVKTLIDRLSPLLYRDQNGKDGVRVHHLSVTEFLIGPSCPSEFRVDLQQANAELSVRCLTTMTKELKFNICDLETSLLANAEIQGLDKLVDKKIPDGLQYSCMHWSSHLCSDSNPTSTAVSALLDGFFAGPRPLYWIEVLSLMGKVPVAISALRQIKSCTKVRRCSDHSDSI
jgi:NACHT domain